MGKKILVELFRNLYFKTFEKNIWHKSFTTTQSIRSVRSSTFQNGSLSLKTEGLEPIWDHRSDKAIAKRTRTAFCRSSSKQVFLIILLKRDFCRVVFLWILRNFQEQLFWKAFVNGDGVIRALKKKIIWTSLVISSGYWSFIYLKKHSNV